MNTSTPPAHPAKKITAPTSAIKPAREPMTAHDLLCAENWATSPVTEGEMRTWPPAKLIANARQSDEYIRELVAEVKRLRPDLAAELEGQ